MARQSLVGVCRSPLGFVAAALAAVAIGVWTAPRAHAYKVLKPTKTEREAKALESKVRGILRQTTAPPAGDTTLKDYFVGWYFPTMTSDAPERLGALAEDRTKLFIQFINTAKNQASRDALLALTQQAASSIAAGDYHPAVRYNATLILGQLDQSLPGGAGAAPPKPVAGATNALTALLQLDEVKGVPVTSAVKIAALVGLERQTRLGVDPQFTDKLANAALAIAQRESPPDDINAEVNNWMRSSAARVLANMYAKGLTPPVHQTLVALIGGTELGLDDRCRVAEAIVPTMYARVEGIDPEEMALAIGKLAKAVLAEERKKAQDYQNEMVGNPGGFGGAGFGGGGFGGRGGFEGGGFMGQPMQDDGPHFERRRFLDRVMAVHKAADAMIGAGSNELKVRVTELATAIKTTADQVSNDKVNEVKVANLVIALARDVTAMVNGWANDAAPAGGGDSGDDDLARR
jgi:hypothetical protein